MFGYSVFSTPCPPIDDPPNPPHAHQVSIGYIPFQKISTNEKINGITLNYTSWWSINEFDGWDFSYGPSIGIRDYFKKVPKGTNTSNPYKKFEHYPYPWLDIQMKLGGGWHGDRFSIFLYPHAGLWWCFPKSFTWNISLSAEIILWRAVFIGASYQFNTPRLGNVFLKQSFEFKIGLFLLDCG
jgi:hypothetical protein